MRYIIITVHFLLIYSLSFGSDSIAGSLPKRWQRAISSIDYTSLGGCSPRYEVKEINKNMLHVRLVFDLQQPVAQDNWQVVIRPKIRPMFNWANHLTPTDSNIIDQHSFRTPAMITQDSQATLIMIPDVDILTQNQQSRWYMDMNIPKNEFTLGMSNYRVSDHVLYTRAQGAVYNSGLVEFGFYMMLFDDAQRQQNPFRPILSFFWDRWGQKEFKRQSVSERLFMTYCKHAYNWAFDSWKDAVWQEFEIEGHKVGAPTFIVNVTQSPNYKGLVNEREFRSVWNQAWFSSLRSASGLYRYARATKNNDLLQKANLTKELALSFAQKSGFFYGLIGTQMEQVEVDGRKYNRSKGWDHYYWGNSNRNPFSWEPHRSPFHILDMSWTAQQMMNWYNELERDERLISYAKNYADALLSIQTKKGFFPAWLDVETLKPYDILTDSPESSMSVTFLLKLAGITGDKKYEKAALKAMNAIIEEIVGVGRWEDFETYWSCCRVGTPDLVGKKVVRNNMYKQCNFSIYWTAEALLECYRLTNDKRYLSLGERTLDEMLMTQASWQPPFIYVDAIGGFGVMNSDAEWNDARQSLFSSLILDYASLVNKTEYTQRGLAALKASFAMMYCPENPKSKEQWEKTWPFFDEKDYGFMMDNYGHDGRTSPDGVGIGEFTIYDWGNGAAAESFMRIYDRYGDKPFKK